MFSTNSHFKKVYLDCTEIASKLRKDLRAAFPAVKFSIRSSRFAGGSSVDVSWTDGPRSHDVKPYAERYEYRHFDGMDDSTSFSEDIVLTPDGLIRQSGSSFVQTHRRESDEAFGAILETLCERYGLEYQGPRLTCDPIITMDGNSRDQPYQNTERLSAIAYKIFAHTDYVQGKVACYYCHEIHDGGCK